jgi:hypothetical protein
MDTDENGPGSTPAPGCGGTRLAFRHRACGVDTNARTVAARTRFSARRGKQHPGRVRSPSSAGRHICRFRINTHSNSVWWQAARSGICRPDGAGDYCRRVFYKDSAPDGARAKGRKLPNGAFVPSMMNEQPSVWCAQKVGRVTPCAPPWRTRGLAIAAGRGLPALPARSVLECASPLALWVRRGESPSGAACL